MKKMFENGKRLFFGSTTLVLRNYFTRKVSVKVNVKVTLRETCPYLEIFWSVFSPNAGKYKPE